MDFSKQISPLGLLIAGILLFLSGFLYDVMFAGIPYQDPTPELQSQWDFHKGIAEVFYLSGMAVCILSVVSFLMKVFRKKT